MTIAVILTFLIDTSTAAQTSIEGPSGLFKKRSLNRLSHSYNKRGTATQWQWLAILEDEDLDKEIKLKTKMEYFYSPYFGKKMDLSDHPKFKQSLRIKNCDVQQSIKTPRRSITRVTPKKDKKFVIDLTNNQVMSGVKKNITQTSLHSKSVMKRQKLLSKDMLSRISKNPNMSNMNLACPYKSKCFEKANDLRRSTNKLPTHTRVASHNRKRMMKFVHSNQSKSPRQSLLMFRKKNLRVLSNIKNLKKMSWHKISKSFKVNELACDSEKNLILASQGMKYSSKGL